MKPLISILILVTLVCSCQKTDDCDPNSPSLIGSWTWIKSVGGIGGSTFTPAITGEKITIKISADSIYREYLNNSLITESKFRLAYKSQESKPYLKFDGRVSLNFEFTDCNNLIITERAADGYVIYYKRKH
jgi:hypothetical protein